MKLKSGRYGWFYGCTRYPDCRGLQKASPDGRPLGVPATIETRKLRSEVLAAVREGLLDQYDLPKKVGEMTTQDCLEALRHVLQVHDIYEHPTMWDLLDEDPLLDP